MKVYDQCLCARAAFSLVELLVAIAVAAVVGGAALALMLHSFDVWENGVGRAGELRAADEFDLDFDRDFASACPSLGFAGTDAECAFWTLGFAPDDDFVLSRVRYAIGENGIVAERWHQGDDLEAPGISTLYRTREFASFAYAGTNVADDAWQPIWNCPTGMPSVISLRRTAPPGRRIHLRRSTP